MAINIRYLFGIDYKDKYWSILELKHTIHTHKLKLFPSFICIIHAYILIQMQEFYLLDCSHIPIYGEVAAFRLNYELFLLYYAFAYSFLFIVVECFL